jgi:hypothetical protein
MYEPVKEHIAPCGMNCGICLAYVREKNRCGGCKSESATLSVSRQRCTIKNCTKLALTSSGFCYECPDYPCKRLRQLDKRYRTKYHMSMIANLGTIRDQGMVFFLSAEKEKWTCPACGGAVCVHRAVCLKCKDDSYR